MHSIFKKKKKHRYRIRGFLLPKRSHVRKNASIKIFDNNVVCRTVLHFIILRANDLLLSHYFQLLKKSLISRGGGGALCEVNRELGFKWTKSVDNRMELIEKDNIRRFGVVRSEDAKDNGTSLL